MEGRGAVNRILDTPSKMLDWWEKVGAVSENAARVQLYAKERRKGTSHLEAAFKARDLLDFTMRGDSGFVQFLIMTIPFLNARMQGLYKIGRVLMDERTRGNLVRRGILLAMAGVGLWFLYKDDDRYKELEDWDKRTYHHFWFGDLHYRIPRPFEMGVPSALMEHVGNVMNGDEQWKHVFDFLKFTFTETFAIDMPQVVKPIAEQWANKSTFTGRPIVGEHLKGLLPSEQKEIWTSESMQKLGELINVSPKRLEELVQGYLSVFGTLLLTGLDSTVTTMFEFPEEPEGRIDDYPMIGRFVKEARDPRYTKYYSRFYDLWTEYDRTMRTIKHHHEMRDVDKAQSLVKNKQKLIRMGPLLTQVRKELTHLRANMKLILQSKLTGKEKEKRLEPFVKRRNVLMKVAYDKVINEL